MIDGCLLDTTWEVLPFYVTSILMLSICNVGIPLGFCFGRSESTELYDLFFKTFRDLFSIDLSTYVIESDRGASLVSICSKYKCKHLGCLKHFKTSLGLSPFSKQIADSVGAKCIKDFKMFVSIYSDAFSCYINTETFKELQKCLAKAGLNYDCEKKEITIANFGIWETISQIERVKFAMPSTTNALEALHGHLNSAVPRRNTFWPAMTRLVSFIITKENKFEKSLRTNFNRECRLIRKRCLDSISMAKQCVYYNTTNETCECGETALTSRMFRLTIPCSHIYSKTKTFPEPPNLKLKLTKNIEGLKLIKEIVDKTEPPAELTQGEKLKLKAVKTIRRFSHFKNEEVIGKDVSSLEINDEFAGVYPTNYFRTVSDGIIKYSSMKKITSKNDLPICQNRSDAATDAN